MQSTAGGQPTNQRVLSLEGGCNFRDIGGYQTIDGRTVKWGHVFRAGVLSYMTAMDHASLASLDIRAICDLRRAEERGKEPTQWPGESAHTFHWDDASDVQTLRKYAAQRPATGEGMFSAMLDLYRGLPERMSTRLHGMLSCIAENRLPLLIHCAAGKDRTGVAVAVLLATLGVPRDTIIEDYLLTNEVGNFESFIRGRHNTELGLADAKHPLLAMPDDVRKVVFSAHPDFLSAAFDAIEESGGFDAYLARTLRVPHEMREKVREALLG